MTLGGGRLALAAGAGADGRTADRASPRRPPARADPPASPTAIAAANHNHRERITEPGSRATSEPGRGGDRAKSWREATPRPPEEPPPNPGRPPNATEQRGGCADDARSSTFPFVSEIGSPSRTFGQPVVPRRAIGGPGVRPVLRSDAPSPSLRAAAGPERGISRARSHRRRRPPSSRNHSRTRDLNNVDQSPSRVEQNPASVV